MKHSTRLTLPTLLFLYLSTAALTAEEPTGRAFRNLEPYKPGYFVNSWFLNQEGSDSGYQNQETIIRFSLKRRLTTRLYFAYSHKAFWQIYDLANSRPFREHNYNPELFLDFGSFRELDSLRLGLFEHESNGEQMRYDTNGNPVNRSRTWDRCYLYLEKRFNHRVSLSAKAWVVTSPRRPEYRAFYDDNPDMQQYLGSGEIRLEFDGFGTHTTLMLRRGWKAGTETAQLDLRIPLSNISAHFDWKHDLYLQAFNGYGDSLNDYNRKVTRAAIGISLY